MAYKIIRPRHGIKSLWDTYKSRIYKLGEMLVESPEGGVGSGPVNIKFGDGVTDYENLPYAVEAPISQLIEGSNKPMTSGAGYDIQAQVTNLSNKTEDTNYVTEYILSAPRGTTHLLFGASGGFYVVSQSTNMLIRPIYDIDIDIYSYEIDSENRTIKFTNTNGGNIRFSVIHI